MSIARLWPKAIEDPLEETQAVEYKSPVDWATLRPKIAKCALSLANTELGGIVVIGVEDNDGVKARVGISEAVLGTYDLQTLPHEVSSFGSAGFNVSAVSREVNDMTFIVVGVSPFQENPIICCRSEHPGGHGPREGVIYYRNAACEDHAATETEFRLIMERTTRLSLHRWGPALSGCVAANGGPPAAPGNPYEQESGEV